MRRALPVVIALLVVVASGLWLGRGAAPELAGALQALAVPPSPVLSPEQALASFRVAKGFRVELVASEPLVEDPVALAWDGRGRLFVVEMRGLMPDAEGRGEDQPVGRVVVLEDDDGDGRMDESHVFLDALVLPRAIAVLPEGVLIGEPPHLWLCRDADDDRRCDEPLRVGEYGVGAENAEHSENGLLPGLDGWLYNAKSARRLRLRGGRLEEGRTLLRGQWGIAQDDEGRLYTNNDSSFALVDPWPAEGFLRHPGMRPETGGVPGVAVDLAPGAEVFAVHSAFGAIPAQVEGTQRADGRLLHPTGVSGIAVQRSPALGEEGIGDLFVPEVVGNVVARFRPEPKSWTAEHLLEPDPDFGQREFLASTDERFRPVSVSFGPHGGLLVVDMYRGIIQDRTDASDYLRAYIERQGRDRPLGLGRIWRVVREDRPLRPLPADPGRGSLGERIALLDDADGAWRDLAARWLVQAGAPAVEALQSGWVQLSPRARVHALWVMAQRGALGGELLGRAVADPAEAVRRAAWRAAASVWSEPPRGRSRLEMRAEEVRIAQLAARVLSAEVAKSREEAVLAALALGEHAALPRVQTALAQLLGRAQDDEVLRAAVLSGLAGREVGFATKLLAGRPWRIPVEPRDRALSDLSRLLFLRLGAAGDDAVARRERDGFVAWLERLPAGTARTALLDGLGRAARVPGQRPMVLSGPPRLFAAEPDANEADPAFLEAWRRARQGITWIGDE